MSVGLQFGGSLLTQRLVRICVTCIGQQGYRQLHPKSQLPRCTLYIRSFGTDPKGEKGENENGSKTTDNPDPSPQTLTPMHTLGRGLFGKRRPLSPLERINRLLPQDSIAPEVLQLREENQEVEQRESDGVGVQKDHKTHSSQGEVESAEPEVHIGHDTVRAREEKEEGTVIDNTVLEPNGCPILREGTNSSQEEGYVTPMTPTLLPGEHLLTFGELLLAEYRKKGRVEFRKMFQLQDGQRLQSSWGTIGHSDIAGRHAGDFIRTIHGTPILIRRPNLEEYVLYMKRGPAIAYPKDASTMLMMMDVTEGDCVLESGSGSGAMSLFLSRAVGSKGSVMSVEIREDHHRRAVLNYNRWRSSWILRRGEEWPDNVQFLNADLQGASLLLAGRGFHSIALDMVSPHLVLPTVTPHLHPGAVCAVYLANITQVIDLLEGLRWSALPMLCERIIEVQLRDWLLAPAIQKDGRFCRRKAPPSARSQEEEEKGENDKSDEKKEYTSSPEPAPYGSVPYIARPHPEQASHTAFLVKLRKSQG
ncbi:tRNA (adenine(58)-N(1))-methyltransferase, mitochondrial isoform X1 [Coregonus clupeaformis]|uniref:tRNA (adenine(58)-N(1))-methyltransferase, mitochondrial isoform X1 n=2 Tax=Coregonus clupeaformis TaxID=59861 RepID=UPI001BE0BBC0|nr:tRNA (adenine(58)-N(1))-methyltransferase, mitochondrial isoform X1 [Coregonus clupeaformis]